MAYRQRRCGWLRFGPSLSVRQARGLTVHVGNDTLLLRRGGEAFEVYPQEVRHLVDALVEGAVELVDELDEDDTKDERW